MAHQPVDRLNGYRVEIDFALSMGDGPLLRESRTRIAGMELTLGEQRELMELDEMVMDEIIGRDDLQPYLLEDDPSRPPAQWWWHLGKLRAGTYPAELLPPHLRALYRPAQRAAA
jgi:hypothetical protein